MADDSFVIDDEKHLSDKMDDKFRELFKDMKKEFEESKKKESDED